MRTQLTRLLQSLHRWLHTNPEKESVRAARQNFRVHRVTVASAA
jgi:hypothetical protein